MEKHGGWFERTETENYPILKFSVKMQVLFLIFCLQVFFSHFCNSVTCFSISKLENAEDFFNFYKHIFLNVTINVSINDY